MKSFHENLRAMREDRDLKQADVARMLGITQQKYSTYERGQYAMPLRHLVTLARAYGVSTDYLLGLTPYPHPLDDAARSIGKTTTVGALVSDIISFDASTQKAAADYVELLKLKQKKGN